MTVRAGSALRTTRRAALRTGPWPGDGDGPWRAARRTLRRRAPWLLGALVVAAAALTAVQAAGGPSVYRVQAVFARAPGLFPGADVQVLGVPVGTVSSVTPVGDEVRVDLSIDRGHVLPARAAATLVSPQLLGEPSIELSPGYTGGPALRPGAVIPMRRTAVPVSTEQVLKSLSHYLGQVSSRSVGSLVTNLAQDLHGQGEHLRTLIAGAAGTLKLLATKAGDLGRLNGSLAHLTGTLDARTQQITQLITDYDTVSGVVARHSTQLGDAVVQLSAASTQLVHLLTPNLAPLESDVGTVTTVGRTLDRNLSSIDEVLASSRSLFTGARRVYTPTYNWITLNVQTPLGLTGALITNQVRDRLAGVCRRILANRASGLSATQRQTLASCGNPSSSFFDPILAEVPSALNAVRSGKSPGAPSPAQLFTKGLATIPGISQSGSAAGTPSSQAQPGGASPEPSGAPTSTGATAPATGSGSSAGTSGTCLGGVLGGLLTCSSTTGSGSGTGGLLAFHRPGQATGTAGAPALGARAARSLPPLPSTAPGAPRRHPRAAHRHRFHRRSAAAHGVRARPGPGRGGGSR